MGVNGKEWENDFRDPRGLLAHPRNPRTHSEEQVAELRAAIREWGFTNPPLIEQDGTIIAGHARAIAAAAEGLPGIPVRVRSSEHPLSDAQRLALIVADNKLALNAGWDEEQLAGIMRDLIGLDYAVPLLGFSPDELGELLAPRSGDGGAGQGAALEPNVGALAGRFLVPPFSVLNAREGWWQQRKAAWIALGIQSEIGRETNLIGRSEQDIFSVTCGILYAKAREMVAAERERLGDAFDLGEFIARTQRERGREGRSTAPVPDGAGANSAWLFKAEDGGFEPSGAGAGTSIFDPVLAEIAYRWFCPPGGVVLDPFAGGSVRGIVAAKLGLEYVGIDLRKAQVAANRLQWIGIAAAQEAAPLWIAGDSRELPALVVGLGAFDFVFTCPPYFDLEVYSDDARDLSSFKWPGFCAAYRSIIFAAAAALKPDRFACIVVGEVRDPLGNYRGLVPETIAAAEAAGLRFYNEAILITAVGSLPIRAGRMFSATRKLGKTHQNVLVFVKGDARKATEACGVVDVADPSEGFGEALAPEGSE